MMKKLLSLAVVTNGAAVIAWALWALSNGVGPGLIQETALWTEAHAGFVLLTALVIIPNYLSAELSRSLVAAVAPGQYWFWIGLWLVLLIPQWYLYIAIGRWLRRRISRKRDRAAA